MKTTSTKVATVGATIGVVAVLLAMSGALAPVFAASPQANANANSTTSPAASVNGSIVPPLAVGQNITIASTQGHYRVVGGNESQEGPASGTVVFTVTGKFHSGYTLAISSGTLNLNGTAFTIASGSAETGPRDHHMVGQGTTTPVSPVATPGTFLLRATARGSFGGLHSTMSLDLQSGTTEYAIALVGTIKG